MLDEIRIKRAAQHNLKRIDVTLPRNKLIVVTGPSGSGKSSLAFDTIFAEGQRRYIECLSAYARQFIDQMEKPEVESVEGISPSISIDQKTISTNPRSTVGTITEVYDLFRLLFARVGTPHCPSLRPGRLVPDARGDPEAHHRAGPRRQGPHPGPRHQGAQGRVPAPLRAPAQEGLPPGPGQRRPARPRGRHPPREEPQAHDRGPRRHDQDRPRRRAPSALRRRQGPRSLRRRGPRRRRNRQRALLLPDPPLPLLRGQPGRARAAQLLLQQPLRRLSEVPRPRLPDDP